MFLSEWREFPSASCLAGKGTWWQLASRFCWNRARRWHASEFVSFLVWLRTYQHPGIIFVHGLHIVGHCYKRLGPWRWRHNDPSKRWAPPTGDILSLPKRSVWSGTPLWEPKIWCELGSSVYSCVSSCQAPTLDRKNAFSDTISAWFQASAVK